MKRFLWAVLLALLPTVAFATVTSQNVTVPGSGTPFSFNCAGGTNPCWPLVQIYDGTTLATVNTNGGINTNVILSTPEGTTADAAYSGTGNASVIAALKGIYAAATGSIPAGTNSIGTVGLNAGSNAIGSITNTGFSVTGTLPAGANVIGKVGIDQTTPGTTNGVQVIAALPAGSNTIGAVTQASGPWTANLTQVLSAALSATNPLFDQIVAGTAGGASTTGNIAANNTTAVVVKASAGTLYGVQLYGIGSAPAYLKIYNATSATCGSGTPVKRLMIPAAATAANGAGSNITFGPEGVAFGTGITYCVTTGITDADTTAPAASTFLVNLDWK